MSTFLAAAGLLAAASVGRVGEDGSGAMWIAPELVESTAPARTCGQTVTMKTGELVFEFVDGSTAEIEAAREVAASTRKGVDFEWNPRTGELGLGAARHGAVFADVERATARHSSLIARSCGPD